MQLSPDTELIGWHSSSGYHFDKKTLFGFSHTHLSGTGMGGLGDILFLPFTEDKAKYIEDSDDYREAAGRCCQPVRLPRQLLRAAQRGPVRAALAANRREAFPEWATREFPIDIHTIVEFPCV